MLGAYRLGSKYLSRGQALSSIFLLFHQWKEFAKFYCWPFEQKYPVSSSLLEVLEEPQIWSLLLWWWSFWNLSGGPWHFWVGKLSTKIWRVRRYIAVRCHSPSPWCSGPCIYRSPIAPWSQRSSRPCWWLCWSECTGCHDATHLPQNRFLLRVFH